MRKGLTLFLAGAMAAALAAPAPAHAWRRDGGYYHRGHGGLVGAGIAAGVLGLGAAAIIASQPRYYYAPPPVVVAPPPVYYAPGYYTPGYYAPY